MPNQDYLSEKGRFHSFVLDRTFPAYINLFKLIFHETRKNKTNFEFTDICFEIGLLSQMRGKVLCFFGDLGSKILYSGRSGGFPEPKLCTHG